MNSARDPLENKPQPQDASQTKKKRKGKRKTLDVGKFISTQTGTKGLFEIHLFCWNWKFFAESTIDKSKN